MPKGTEAHTRKRLAMGHLPTLRTFTRGKNNDHGTVKAQLTFLCIVPMLYIKYLGWYSWTVIQYRTSA